MPRPKWKHDRKTREILAMFIAQHCGLAYTEPEIAFLCSPDGCTTDGGLEMRRFQGNKTNEARVLHAIKELRATKENSN